MRCECIPETAQLRIGEGFADVVVGTAVKAAHAVELRGASLLNLASQLPIKPICDLTGISAQAAGDWADLAARDWNAYPSLRTTGPTATLGGAADLSG